VSPTANREGAWTLLTGDALATLRTLPAASVHCIVTSPPYWGLRDYGVSGQIGAEATPEEYVARLIEVFREARRVLRDEGTCWVNLGDSYAGSWGNQGRKAGRGTQRAVRGPMLQRFDGAHGGKYQTKASHTGSWVSSHPTLKAKDLVGVPWQFAFAAQRDGWFLRSDIIWSKPSVMPESVRDRPTRSHEYVFLLAKRQRYFFDSFAVREPCASLDPKHPSYRPSAVAISENGRREFTKKHRSARSYNPQGRNIRSVWTVATRPFKGAHFATFPPKLIEPAILAGTSEYGCCSQCGAPWLRRVARRRTLDGKPTEDLGRLRNSSRSAPSSAQGVGHWRTGTIVTSEGWSPSCKCDGGSVTPCVVLDPFAGSGTTGVVAVGRGRRFVGIDLNPEYVVMASDRVHGAERAGSTP
jgi:DNA modification methylase